VQNAASANLIGRAAASVQLSRSIGAAGGTAFVGAVLFATLAMSHPDAAGLFGDLLRKGGEAGRQLGVEKLALLQGDLGSAFRIAFLSIAAFAGLGAALAWSIPKRRL
jgi:hypothetical protein